MMQRPTEPPKNNGLTAYSTNPESFNDVFGLYCMLAPRNETVFRLERDNIAKVSIIRALTEMEQHKFINLVTTPHEARIVMALYAGDGIVTKITPQDYMPLQRFPFVMFPFAKKRLQGTEMSGHFVIENFPYLNSHTINERDVDTMRSMLADCGLEFDDQDDKPGNIRRMPDKSLAIIDGNAVRAKGPLDQEALDRHVSAWDQKVKSLYPELYVPGHQYVQSLQTDYRVLSYTSTVATLQPATMDAPVRPPWYRRLLSSDTSLPASSLQAK